MLDENILTSTKISYTRLTANMMLNYSKTMHLKQFASIDIINTKMERESPFHLCFDQITHFAHHKFFNKDLSWNQIKATIEARKSNNPWTSNLTETFVGCTLFFWLLRLWRQTKKVFKEELQSCSTNARDLWGYSRLISICIDKHLGKETKSPGTSQSLET